MTKYFISSKKSLLNPAAVWMLLKDQSWSKDVPIEYVQRFIKYSLCVGAYLKENNQLVGFGRTITDYTTYAYNCDLVVDPNHRNNGLGSLLIDARLNHPSLQGLKTISLRVSPEGQPFYLNRGFKIAENPSTIVERENLAIYTDPNFVNLYKEVPQCTTYSRLK